MYGTANVSEIKKKTWSQIHILRFFVLEKF